MKKRICTFLLTGMLAALCACGNPSKGPENTGSTGSAQNAQTEQPAPDSPAPPAKRMDETTCEGLEIDAEVPARESLALSTYQANFFHISSADALALLGGDAEIEREEPHNYDPNGFRLVLRNGAEIYHGDGLLSYRPETEAADKYSEIASLLLRYAETHSEEEPHTLPFLSPEDAVRQAEALIGKLNITGEPVADKIVGLSGAEIMAWQGELMKDESYSSWVELGKTAVLEDLTAEDDAYYLSFYFTYQDLPVFNQDREPGIAFANEGFLSVSMKAELLITPKGICLFTLQNALSPQGHASEVQSILSAEEALQKVVEKYENTITYGTQCITAVWLEYIPVPEPNGNDTDAPLTLTPYWCFGVIDAELDHGGKITNAERINAITGDDLAYEW